MKEGREFIGRAYEPEEKEGLNGAINEWSREASKPLDGETEKTEEQTQMIETVNALIASELASLGIAAYKPMPPERVHLLPESVFNRAFPDKERGGFFIATSDAVYIKEYPNSTKVRMLATIAHELVHHASTAKFYADKESAIYDARLGYRIHSPWKGPQRANRLRGFNELMTDCTTVSILFTHQPELEEKFGITEDDVRGPIYTYMNYAPILESIVSRISNDKQVSENEIFKLFQRGLFEHNILVLKDVEKSFGKGSLEVLSFLESLKEDADNKRLEEMIKNFFAEEDDTKRQTIRSEILAFFSQSAKEDTNQDESP